MARFTQSGSGDGSGTPGPTGPQGPAGADGADGTNGLDGEGFNFRGEWVTDTLYLKNDVVTQNGSSYIANYDYQSAYGPSSDGELWSPIALKGTDGADGADGSDGAQGDPGADALWNYTGEYNGGASYAVGDIATYDGQLWYRYNSNGGNVGDTPSPGLWNLLAAKGADGADGLDGADGANGNDGSPGLVYLGNYISGNGYIANIAVVKGSDNNLYIATSSGGLGDPVGNTAEWAIFLPKGADGAQGEPGPQGDPGADGADANLDTGTTTINSYNPVWSGTGLAYTNTPATGSYIKIGNLVIVQIDVIFTNVSNFGTGAYSLTLPFASKYHTDVYGGSLHKITNQGIDHYSLKGHLAPTSSNFTLWAIGSSAADQAFKNNAPVGIDTDDKFHMSFSYICE
jgi:hypothetical protein